MSFLGLTVYGPEVARSGLTSALDTFISEKAGLKIEERFVSLHSRQSIEAYYSLTGSTGGKHWPLVLELFDMRPAYVTVWQGHDALKALQDLKGKTQPALAAPGTVRSLFYCDNPVTNLIHVSDDVDIMESELDILRARCAGRDELGWYALDSGEISHSSFHILLKMLGEELICKVSEGEKGLAFDHARKAFERAITLTRDTSLQSIVKRYLAGNPDSIRSLIGECGEIPAWDRLILQAGLFAMPHWTEMLQPTTDLKVGAVI